MPNSNPVSQLAGEIAEPHVLRQWRQEFASGVPDNPGQMHEITTSEQEEILAFIASGGKSNATLEDVAAEIAQHVSNLIDWGNGSETVKDEILEILKRSAALSALGESK